jgi:glycosyltransferase involved in cell wall biosynthesis
VEPVVSVIICTYNEAKYIQKCIDSLLLQSYRNIEVIILDDGSTDDTKEIVQKNKDPRIRYIERGEHCGTMGKLRNFAISLAKGSYLFFTDADCVASRNWIQNGITAFKNYHVKAIEGKIIYCRSGYKPALSDRVTENVHGGQWMTANMAFSKEIFSKYSFNANYAVDEDRELALRLLKEFQIPFINDFLVFHQKKKLNVRGFLRDRDVRLIKYKIKLISELDDDVGNKFRILNPRYFCMLLFPPLIVAECVRRSIRSMGDLKLLPFVWIKAIIMRYKIWRYAFKYRVLVI